jgi:hypothetical protein
MFESMPHIYLDSMPLFSNTEPCGSYIHSILLVNFLLNIRILSIPLLAHLLFALKAYLVFWVLKNLSCIKGTFIFYFFSIKDNKYYTWLMFRIYHNRLAHGQIFCKFYNWIVQKFPNSNHLKVLFCSQKFFNLH